MILSKRTHARYMHQEVTNLNFKRSGRKERKQVSNFCLVCLLRSSISFADLLKAFFNPWFGGWSRMRSPILRQIKCTLLPCTIIPSLIALFHYFCTFESSCCHVQITRAPHLSSVQISQRKEHFILMDCMLSPNIEWCKNTCNFSIIVISFWSFLPLLIIFTISN